MLREVSADHPSAFTYKATHRLNRIITPVVVTAGYPAADMPADIQSLEVRALWDTGATGSHITRDTAEKLGLVPTGLSTIHHAGGEGQSNTYIVNLVLLPSRLLVPMVQVADVEETQGSFGAIIGMNIISLGDFAVTARDNATWVSFCLPSSRRIDFVDEVNGALFRGVGRNDLCPCGSGKKFKYCHGARATR